MIRRNNEIGMRRNQGDHRNRSKPFGGKKPIRKIDKNHIAVKEEKNEEKAKLLEIKTMIKERVSLVSFEHTIYDFTNV